MALLAAGTIISVPYSVHAVDAYGKRFDPPRVYFAHASLNKSGITSAIKGQANFIDIYMTPIDNTSGNYTGDGFTWSALVPAFVRIPDADEQGLAVEDVAHEGLPYKRITRAFDARQVEIRSLNGQWGSSHEWLWYRLDDDLEIPDAMPAIEVSLQYKGTTCFTDTSRLRIYEALVAPRLPPEDFKLWLHYGPRYRMGKWDELADYMGKAGFNTIQSLESIEFNQAMKKRGFYLIYQRSGSYHNVNENEFHDCIREGPAWFEKQDTTGEAARRLKSADATILDFEPGPSGKLTEFRDLPWLHEIFKERNDLPPDLELTDELVRTKYFKEWVDMRQGLAAQVVKNWAAYCRSVNPDIATIITQGGVGSFDKTSDLDHGRYADDVTYIDPMNFTRTRGIETVKRWMDEVPQGQFTGCQNVSSGGYGNLFIPDQDMMLHTLAAALIGCRGTSFYAGWALDAANFVLLNRVMTFLSRHRELIFEGTPDPPGLLLAAVPKEDTEIDLGGGTKIRNVYPDWEREATIRGYHNPKLGQYLAVINNRSTKEPCYVKVTAAVAAGSWYVSNDEAEEVYSLGSETALSAEDLANGVYLVAPPFDFRGMRLRPVSEASTRLVNTYDAVPLEPVLEKALAYAEAGDSATGAEAAGGVRLGFDDFDADNQFEYLVETPGQQVWVGQGGTILKWKIGDVELRTKQKGLCTDMLWLPSSERSNGDLGSVMRLQKKHVHEDGVELVFDRGVALASLGGMVSLRQTKTFAFAGKPGIVDVTVTFFNDSLSMEVPSIELSHRVHNYIDHEERGTTVFWAHGGSGLTRTDRWATHAILSRGLSELDTQRAYTRCEVLDPRLLGTFGEFFSRKGLLLSVHPNDPSKLLQLLDWRAENGIEGLGTLEWIYRPVILDQGRDVTIAYRMKLETGLTELTAAMTARPVEEATRAANLLFHVNFENGANAVTAKGESGEGSISGSPTWVDTPGGKGIHLPEGAQVSYLPEGNIDPARGTFQITFKPLWHGGDGRTRYFMQLRPLPGFMYFGKLDDGRFLCNMFDVTGAQHWPNASLANLEAGGWHTATAAWDTEAGTIQIFLDGERMAEVRGEPWEMGRLDNDNEDCRLLIGGAPIVVDDVKIWAGRGSE